MPMQKRVTTAVVKLIAQLDARIEALQYAREELLVGLRAEQAPRPPKVVKPTAPTAAKSQLAS